MCTDEWRTVSWYCGDDAANEVCAWASAREDGEDQLRAVCSALALNAGHGGARELVRGVITAAEPGWRPSGPWNARLSGQD